MFFFLILKGIWAGVLHHVVGEHEWFLPYSDAGPSSCRHDPISEDTMRDKEWMKKGSPPHEALRKIVLDKRFLHNIPYYLNFRYNRKAFYVYMSFQIMKFTRHDKHMLCTCNTVELSSYVLVFFYIEVQRSWRATITTC